MQYWQVIMVVVAWSGRDAGSNRSRCFPFPLNRLHYTVVHADIRHVATAKWVSTWGAPFSNMAENCLVSGGFRRLP